MLSVLEKAIKRRKKASQSSKSEDCHLATQKNQSDTEKKSIEENVELPAKKSDGPTIKAEILGKSPAGTKDEPSCKLVASTNLTRDIVFIDSGILDISKLLRELDPLAEVHVLDPESDGVDQIVAHLAGREKFLVVHIFCHGDEGILNLGSGQVSAATITNIHSEGLSKIGAALSENGEILIYGCDFCSGVNGRVAATQLAMLTGAVVAAATDIFADNNFEFDKVGKQASIESPAELNPELQTTAEPISSELTFHVPKSGFLDANAEIGLMHSAGLVGATLRSARDGSDASIKIFEPGISGSKPHLLPNGAELTLYSNGAFTYQSEVDADDGKAFTCIAVHSDHAISKFGVLINADRRSETCDTTMNLSDGQETGTTDGIATSSPAATPARTPIPNPASQLSINIPDTSTGSIPATTTMVDAPLIFLQRNQNPISVSGSDNDIIVMKLSATNGTLSARSSKGAQVEGYNSKSLTIKGSATQINAVLDGLRFVNSRNYTGPAELVATAKYDNGRGKIEVSETVAISVTSIEDEAEAQARSIAEGEQSSQAEVPIVGTLETLTTESSKTTIVEVVATIGDVVTIANSGETLKLKEGDLQINSDGSFSFCLKEGYSNSSSQVTCSTSYHSSSAGIPSEIILDLGQLLLVPEQVFTGNVFSIDTSVYQAATEKPADAVEVARKRKSDPTKSRIAETKNPMPEISADTGLIAASAPVVLADVRSSTVEHPSTIDRSEAISQFEIERWELEEFNGHSINFSFDHEGRQTAITPTMQIGQISVDVYQRQATLFLDVNCTLDTQIHGKAVSYHIDLNNSTERPDWIQEIRNGFTSIDMLDSSEIIELNVSAKMKNGKELRCQVSVDRLSGAIKPLLSDLNKKQVYQRAQALQVFSSGYASA